MQLKGEFAVDGQGADPGVKISLLGPGQNHRRQHHIGRDGEEGTLGEGDHGQGGRRVAASRQIEDAVIELAKHGNPLAGATP
jgi:hypothetical protein